MSDPWAAASSGFNRGVSLGVRAKERKEDKEEKQKDREISAKRRKEDVDYRNRTRTEDVEHREKEFGIKEEKASRDKTEFDAKQATKKAKKTLNVARAQVANDSPFEAASTLSKFYNEQVPNGDEVRIFQRDMNADNPAFKDAPKGKNVVVQSKTGGLEYYKDMASVIEQAAAMASVDSISGAYEASRKALAQKNAAAAESPFLAEDGKQYINTYEMGPGGIPTQGKPKPFEGMRRAAPVTAALTQELGRKPTDDEKKIKLGMREKEKGAPTAKEGIELRGKELDQQKKRLDLALRPFSKSGKSVFDFNTGQMSTGGSNAIESIDTILSKSESDLTPAEKKLLPQAKKARALYDNIFSNVTSGIKDPDAPPVSGAKKAPDGKWYVQKDGKWYVVESE